MIKELLRSRSHLSEEEALRQEIEKAKNGRGHRETSLRTRSIVVVDSQLFFV